MLVKRNISLFAWNILIVLIGAVILDGRGREYLFSGVILTGITLTFSYVKYRLQNDQMFKELFQEFNKKYDDKFNSRLSELTLDARKEGFSLTQNDKSLIIDYINLCAEEYLWFQKGQISKDVWNSWENGMTRLIKSEPILQVFREELEYTDSYYGFLKYIKPKILTKKRQ